MTGKCTLAVKILSTLLFEIFLNKILGKTKPKKSSFSLPSHSVIHPAIFDSGSSVQWGNCQTSCSGLLESSLALSLFHYYLLIIPVLSSHPNYFRSSPKDLLKNSLRARTILYEFIHSLMHLTTSRP